MKFDLKNVSYFVLISSLWGQSVLTNTQLDAIKDQIQSSSAPVLEEIGQPKTEESLLEKVTLEPAVIESVENQYFGYDYFKREINFFDNIPTPPDFKLGPGDEITISMWGETNLREDFTINKEGLIFYNNVGFISLSNKNLKEAEIILIDALSSIYSTLKDKNNQTQLTLELGKLKSINVYFSGQITNSGINLIHPFSDVFSAIVQSGGVKLEGSLRNVQLIRNGTVTSTFDFYSFFIDGKNNFSNIRILDGDVIHIPVVSKRIEILGEVNTNGYFEILENESLKDLIMYAGGFTANASSKTLLTKIIPISKRISDDNAQLSQIISFHEISSVKLNHGDSATVLAISDVAKSVEVVGRVKNPGNYPANQTLKDVLTVAGGFTDPIYRKSIRDGEILVLRRDENQFYGLEFIVSYEKSNTFQLIPGDKIFVYEDYKYNNSLTVRIGGEVKKKGPYQLKKAMTVQDIINLADGFTEMANKDAIVVSQGFGDDNESIQINNVSLDFILSSNSNITVLPISNVVNVQGNVYSPGLVSYKKGDSVKDYIENAGGLKEDSLIKDIYLKRANGNTINIKRINGIFLNPKEGDTIFVPIDESPSSFDTASFLSDILSVLTNLVAILAIIDNNKD